MALSIVFFILTFLWFLVGLVPLPISQIGGMTDFPKRYPWIFIGIALVLLGSGIGFHMLGF